MSRQTRNDTIRTAAQECAEFNHGKPGAARMSNADVLHVRAALKDEGETVTVLTSRDEAVMLDAYRAMMRQIVRWSA
jgi:hypothetical protein